MPKAVDVVQTVVLAVGVVVVPGVPAIVLEDRVATVIAIRESHAAVQAAIIVVVVLVVLVVVLVVVLAVVDLVVDTAWIFNNF